MNFFEEFSKLGKIIKINVSSRKRQKKYRNTHEIKNDKKYAKKYRENHKEEKRIYAIEYTKRLKEKRKNNLEYNSIIRKKEKEYYHRPGVKKRQKELRKIRNDKNREKLQEYYRDWSKLPKIRDKRNERRRENIHGLIKARLRTRMRAVFNVYQKKGLLPNTKINHGIDWISVCEHLDKTKPENWKDCHIDHVKPLVLFDLTSIAELKKANSPENLQWLIAKENLIKSDKF